MKTLQVNHVLRQRIRDAAYPKETVDATLHRLVENYGDKIKEVDSANYFTNINVADSTHKELVDIKSSHETIVKVIEKLLDANDDAGDSMVIIDDKKLSLDEFKCEVLDEMNVVLGGAEWDVLCVCTPSGMVVSTVDLGFESADAKDEFISFMRGLGYIE